MDQRQRSFDEEIKFFLNACPGPAVAKHGLHIAAFQEVRGIQGLEPSGDGDELREAAEYGRRSVHGGSDRGYLHRVAEIAERVGCRRAYLSEAALRHGFQYSRAVRWIRFLHGMALRAVGVDALTLAMRLGFSDLAGWSRFTRRLGGKDAEPASQPSPRLLGAQGVEDLLLSPTTTDVERRETNRGEDNQEQ